MRMIAQKADGDARKALNLLDACCTFVLCRDSKLVFELSHYDRVITAEMVDSNMNQRFVRYDKNGEEHYNIASAFQKSIVRLFSLVLILAR